MLKNEAIWIGKNISLVPLKKESIVLNFGSQTLKYNSENKYLMENVIIPIKKISQLKNLDLKYGEGIDFSGNLYDDGFFNKIKINKFDCVLICNVLDHVTNVSELCKRIAELVKPDGYIIFTGPYQYPLHYDPIDNGFRPEIDDLLTLFNDFKLIKGEIITDYSYSYYLFSNLKTFTITLLRVLTPFYKFTKWKHIVLPKFKWWNKKFKVTCIILKKNEK